MLVVQAAAWPVPGAKNQARSKLERASLEMAGLEENDFMAPNYPI